MGVEAGSNNGANGHSTEEPELEKKGMLVLTRRPGQGILIGEDIEIIIISADSGHTRIGIKAPRKVTIMRREVRGTEEESKYRPTETELT